MIARRSEELAQSARTAILSRIERADQLEWPSDSGSSLMVRAPYSDTEQKYNECIMLAISAGEGSASSDSSEIVFKHLSRVIAYEDRLRELFRLGLLSYPDDFSYRANVLATSL